MTRISKFRSLFTSCIGLRYRELPFGTRRACVFELHHPALKGTGVKNALLELKVLDLLELMVIL